jgi:hypothetical protein
VERDKEKYKQTVNSWVTELSEEIVFKNLVTHYYVEVYEDLGISLSLTIRIGDVNHYLTYKLHWHQIIEEAKLYFLSHIRRSVEEILRRNQ